MSGLGPYLNGLKLHTGLRRELHELFGRGERIGCGRIGLLGCLLCWLRFFGFCARCRFGLLRNLLRRIRRRRRRHTEVERHVVIDRCHDFRRAHLDMSSRLFVRLYRVAELRRQRQPLGEPAEDGLLRHLVPVSYPRTGVSGLAALADGFDLVLAHHLGLRRAVLEFADGVCREHFAAILAAVDLVDDDLAHVFLELVVFADHVGVQIAHDARAHRHFGKALIVDDELTLDDAALAVLEWDKVRAPAVRLDPELRQCEHRTEE